MSYQSPLTAHLNEYQRLATQAGFKVEDDNTVFAYDLVNRFIIVVENNNEPDEFMVAFFIKSKSGGDYPGVPEFEGSLEDCMKYVMGIIK